jgi:uncharacterized protein (DUF2236 family)
MTMTMTTTRPGPGSVTWRLHGERLSVLGWPRAVLLQIAHPGIAAGVAYHSSFRGGMLTPYRRLVSTVCAMRTLTFGSDDAARGVAAHINAIHDRVRGSMAPTSDGPAFTYSARDPRLLAWVHLTLVDSTLRVYERLVEPLAAADRDGYCEEAAEVASWFGVPEPLVPRNHRALEAAMSHMLASGELRATGEARGLARDVLRPPLAWLGGPIGGFVRRLTIAELPPEIRTIYGLESTARDERALARDVRIVRACRSRAPRVLTQWSESRAERE